MALLCTGFIGGALVFLLATAAAGREGRAGIFTCHNGLMCRMKSANWYNTTAPASATAAFRMSSRRSSMRLLRVPLIEIQERNGKIQFELPWPGRLRADLHGVDEQRVPQAVSLLNKFQQSWRRARSFKLNRPQLLARRP